MQSVFKNKTKPQIQHQKDTDREQRDRACGFLFHMILSLPKNLALTADAAGAFVHELQYCIGFPAFRQAKRRFFGDSA